jgi:hypothetical protein
MTRRTITGDVHTTEELDRTDFEYRSGGRTVSRNEVMPPIAVHDRVGVVMDTGADGVGAGNFLLSCVTAFYDRLRETKDDFFEYPDYYTFQTTAEPADYGMLDVYPDHKNLAVEPDAEHLLRAINDRAITVLLVPDVRERTPEIEDVTRRSAERRIEHCYLYAPDGQPSDPGFSIRQPRRPTEEWYRTIVRSVAAAPETHARPFGSGDGHVTQSFRRLPLERALARLPVERGQRGSGD